MDVLPKKITIGRMVGWCVFLSFSLAVMGWLLEVSEWPAWIQAVGSLMALAFAILLPEIDRKARLDSELEAERETEINRSRKLWLQLRQAILLIDRHCSDHVKPGNVTYAPWSVVSSRETAESLVRRVDSADIDDVHPMRARIRQDLVSYVYQAKTLMTLDHGLSYLELENRFAKLRAPLEQWAVQVERDLLGYKPSKDDGTR